MYKIKLQQFEGPLDLLLSLIEQKKFFINEISLAKVTNDYISYIKSISELPAEKRISDTSYFILIAATLILIKSKSLLPNLDLTTEETEKITNLEQRLTLHKIIKNASLDIKKIFGAKIIFGPNDRLWGDPLFIPNKIMTITNIKQLISNVILNLPQEEEQKPAIGIKKIISLDEVIESLTNRIQHAMNLSFKEFSKSHKANNPEELRINVIVSFLAMLELVREGIINVIQNSSFGDIEINKQTLIEN